MDDDRDRPTVDAFFYGDYVCPFSYLLDARLRRLGGDLGLRVHWRPLGVHGAVPSDGLPAEQLGRAPEEQARMEAEVSRQARELGLELELPGFVANSHEALQASEFARDVGEEDFRRVHRAFFRAHFVEGRNLGRRETLLEVADEAELDREGLEHALEDERYRSELERVSEEAGRYEIDGTPTLLVGRHKVVGAAPAEVLREAVERARGDDRMDRSPGEAVG